MKDFILFVGQPFPRRHLEDVKMAIKKLPDVELRIVSERIADTELAELYKNAKALVYVSDIEAFGLPPLEALAYGTTPIVADSPVSHELLGDDAIYCQPTVEGIADGIKRALLKKVEPKNKFTWSDYTNRFLSLCKQIV